MNFYEQGDSESNEAPIRSFTKDVVEFGLNYKTFKIDVPSFKEKYPLSIKLYAD